MFLAFSRSFWHHQKQSSGLISGQTSTILDLVNPISVQELNVSKELTPVSVLPQSPQPFQLLPPSKIASQCLARRLNSSGSTAVAQSTRQPMPQGWGPLLDRTCQRGVAENGEILLRRRCHIVDLYAPDSAPANYSDCSPFSNC